MELEQTHRCVLKDNCLSVCLFGVYRPTRDCLTHLVTSPMPMESGAYKGKDFVANKTLQYNNDINPSQFHIVLGNSKFS